MLFAALLTFLSRFAFMLSFAAAMLPCFAIATPDIERLRRLLSAFYDLFSLFIFASC